jgi:hypothetical protein
MRNPTHRGVDSTEKRFLKCTLSEALNYRPAAPIDGAYVKRFRTNNGTISFSMEALFNQAINENNAFIDNWQNIALRLIKSAFYEKAVSHLIRGDCMLSRDFFVPTQSN